MDNYDVMAGSCPNCVVADKEIEALEDRLDAADRETVAWFDIERVKLTAADALAVMLQRIYNINESFLKEGYGCCFCRDGAGHYKDGEYWHSEHCPFERIDAALRKYREADNG